MKSLTFEDSRVHDLISRFWLPAIGQCRAGRDRKSRTDVESGVVQWSSGTTRMLGGISSECRDGQFVYVVNCL
jgi:hypothetical protein